MLGLLTPSREAPTPNRAHLSVETTAVDLDEEWERQLKQFEDLQARYRLDWLEGEAGTDTACTSQPSVPGLAGAPVPSVPPECVMKFRPWVDRSIGKPKKWIQMAEGEPELDNVPAWHFKVGEGGQIPLVGS